MSAPKPESARARQRRLDLEEIARSKADCEEIEAAGRRDRERLQRALDDMAALRRLTLGSLSEAFGVLGLPTTASESEVRRAYLERARRAHPDVGGTPSSSTRCVVVTRR